MSVPAPETATPAAPAGLRTRAPVLLETAGWADYALLDSGAGRKLERFGELVVDRPEAQALWSPRVADDVWAAADATFVGIGEEEADGRWRFARPRAPSWTMDYDGVPFVCRFTNFRHVGVFPEQASHWDWMVARIAGAARAPRVLNLFAYTGIASLLMARAGAEVTHIDASRKAVGWARENQAAGGLEALKIRWICEDAPKFVAREIRRGNRYDAIVLDPPKFGRGPKNEVWDVFTDLAPLMAACNELLSDTPLFLVLTAYSIRASFMALHEVAAETLGARGGLLESGELVLREEDDGRRLSTSLFSRWSA